MRGFVVAAIALAACGGDDEPPSTEELGCKTLAIMQDKCVSCHGSPPLRGAPMPLTSLAHLRGMSPIFAGTPVAERAVLRMQQTDRPMPPVGEPPLADGDTETVRAWIDAGMPACEADPGAPPEAHPNQIPQDELFTCDPDQPASSPARLRRLDRAEWRFDLPSFSDVNNPTFAKVNPLDPSASDPYSTYASDETVDDLVLDFMLEPGLLGERIGKEMILHANSLRSTTPELSCMFTDDAPTDACMTYFATYLLERAVLFRPALPEEVTRLTAVVKSIVSARPLAERTAALEQIANTAWLTTRALFRSELGTDAGDGRRRLTDDELALALAYTISDRAPGAPRTRYNGGGLPYPFTAGPEGHLPEIAAAALDGSIQDPTVIAALVRTYAGGIDLERVDLAADIVGGNSRRSHGQYWTAPRVGGFFREWLGYETFPTKFKDQPGKTSKYQMLTDISVFSALTASYLQLQAGTFNVSDGTSNWKEPRLVDQLDDMISRIVVEDRDVLKTLLTTTRFYSAATADTFTSTKATHYPYNLDAYVPMTRDGRWVVLPPTERAGVLTHPAWLATHGGNFEDDPSIVHRGKWIRENLLCQFVPPLSAVTVQAMVGPSEPELTARERLDAATADEVCQGCHRLMNSVGYPFEIYNHAGFVRVIEHDGSSPNGSATLVDMPDPSLDGPVTNAIDFSHKLAASNYVERCFIRQAFRYYMGRDETRADACALTRMEAAYDQQGSFIDMLSALVTSDAFRYRTVEGN